MATLGDLVIKMSLDAAGFQNDMGKAAYAAEKNMAKVVAAGNIAAAGLAALAVAAAKAGFAMVGSIKGAIDAADELGKVAQRTGVAVESLSALKHAAQMSDVSFEELTNGLQKLSKAIDSNDKAFKRLGLEARSFKTPDQALAAIADKFAQMEDGAEKTAIAFALLGKSGDRLIPMLNGGAAGLAEMRREAERLGIVMSRDMARSAEQFNDSLTTLNAGLSGIAINIANEVLPTMNSLVAEFTDGMKVGDSFFQALSLWTIEINPDTINALNKELEDLNKRKGALSFEGSADDLRLINNEIAIVTKKLEYIRLQRERERSAALAITGGARDLDPRDIRARGPVAGKFKPATEQSEEALKLFEARAKAMQRELDTAKKLTEVQQVRLDIERGMYKDLTEAQKQYLLGQAKQIDATRGAAESVKKIKEADDRIKALLEKNAREADQIRERNQREKEADSQKDFDTWWAGEQKKEQALAEANARIQKRLEEDAEETKRKNAKALADQQELWEAQKRIREQYQEIFTGGLGDAFVDIVEGTKSVSDAFESMTKSIVHSITQIVAKKLALQAVEGLFGTSAEGGIGGLLTTVFGGGRAFGGSFQAGQAIKVGERGPEYLRPGFGGRVEPMTSATKSTTNNVYMTISTPDASSFKRSQQQVLVDMQAQLSRAEVRR